MEWASPLVCQDGQDKQTGKGTRHLEAARQHQLLDEVVKERRPSLIGRPRRARMYFATEARDISIPSLSSSPWSTRCPLGGFAKLILFGLASVFASLLSAFPVRRADFSISHTSGTPSVDGIRVTLHRNLFYYSVR